MYERARAGREGRSQNRIGAEKSFLDRKEEINGTPSRACSGFLKLARRRCRYANIQQLRMNFTFLLSTSIGRGVAFDQIDVDASISDVKGELYGA